MPRSSDKMAGASSARGYLFVVCAALLWSLSGIAGKALFSSGVTPAQLVQSRVTIASLILLPALGLINSSLLKIRRDQVFQFIILGGFIMAVLQLSYFLAIQHIQVAAAILIQYLAPILVAIFSMIFWKEKYTHVKAAALVLSSAGCYLTAGGYSLKLLGMNLPGVFWGLCSAFFFAGYTLYSERKMHRYSPWTVLFYSLLFAAASLNIVFPPLSVLSVELTAKQWALIGYVAVFGTLIPFGLFSEGINRIRATRAIITATLEPISAAVLAFVLISETLSLPQIAGGILVIAAIVMLQIHSEHSDLSPAAIRERRRGA